MPEWDRWALYHSAMWSVRPLRMWAEETFLHPVIIIGCGLGLGAQSTIVIRVL